VSCGTSPFSRTIAGKNSGISREPLNRLLQENKMSNVVTIASPVEGSNYLVDIAARIKIEHQAVAASLKQSVHHAIAAGELLLEAKEQIPHGEWLPWLSEHCGVTPRSAQGYMRLARNRAELEANTQALAHLTVEGALKSLAAPTLAISSLETEEARSTAMEAIESGTNIRTAVRGARKLDYNARIQAATPKPLEGTYRIILADCPWKYHGLNQADEYGHAERHYDCLDDKQLSEYRPGDGQRTVKELADKDAVLFLWVTAPMLERAFPIIKAWGFHYKTFFVWDKVKHNVGFYNSVRAELLVIATRGSCLPDSGKLIDSVQTIERSNKHSEKPQEFYDIIESMYDHGRKLELFSRKARAGWDSDGNESDERGTTRKLPKLNPDGVSVAGCSLIYAPAGQAGEYAPLSANPYRGCGHGCAYCYVPAVIRMSRPEFDATATPKTDYLENLKKDAAKYQALGITEQVMLSFTTDVYNPINTSLTRPVIQILRDHGLGFCVLTKGGSRALADIDLYRPDRDAFAATLTSLGAAG
jgi:N6-adenosine-specific RNA methylase IME4